MENIPEEGARRLNEIKNLCEKLFKDHNNLEGLEELKTKLARASPAMVKMVGPIVFGIMYRVLKEASEMDISADTPGIKERQLIVDTLKVFCDKTEIEEISLFFNLYSFLLFQIYDHKTHVVYIFNEDYKLSIVDCLASLFKCLTPTATCLLYTKENAPKISPLIYSLSDISKREKFKKLRISALNCLMVTARVLEDDDFNDHVIRNQVAEVFIFFLPGITSRLRSIALDDEKVGHQIPSLSLKAWGRIVTLVMQDYNAADQKINIKDIADQKINIKDINLNMDGKKWKTEAEMEEYLNSVNRTPQWYKATDDKLKEIFADFTKLTFHSHPNVRVQLADTCSLIIDNCSHTMPSTISKSVEIVITLSEDSDDLVRGKSRSILEKLSEKLTDDELKSLFETLEESFYNAIMSTPRKFNGIDEREQMAALNLLIGYINLFGRHNLVRVMHSVVHLKNLLSTLIHVSEFDRSEVSLMEEYSLLDLEITTSKMPWKEFRYFKNEAIANKIGKVCNLLSHYGASQIISDLLLDKILSEKEHRRESIFLLNELITGMQVNNTTLPIISNIVDAYIDHNFWYVPLLVTIDDEGYEVTLGDAQNNIIQACLLVEGIGKVAVTTGEDFHRFMLKTLYLVLERAGSAHPSIRSTGLGTLLNIAQACQYSNINGLINKNIDYLSFHLERKLGRVKDNEGAFNVLTVIMNYSNEEVLPFTSDIVEELLLHINDKSKEKCINSYLRVFKMFVDCLQKWFNITKYSENFKTKKEKIEQYEEFKVSDINEDFSEGEKSTEEMYKEDMEKDIEPQEYKKPEPPVHVKLTTQILGKILHFLPSKDQNRKLLVLETLKSGVEILREWEDELLPIVHQIWSPLVERFKEFNLPLVVNHSFQLLVTLAKLSKEFIRSRTAKEALPSLLKNLEKLAKESYLKDKGAAYRYTQAYKLQLLLLTDLGRVIMDLDMLEVHVHLAMDTVFNYLSDKQPVPLQVAAVDFYKMLLEYDPESVEKKLEDFGKNVSIEYEKNLERIRNKDISLVS